MSDQILRLTAIIKRGSNSDIYLGRIEEISGIISQGQSEGEAYENLLKATRSMLEYKRPEALSLLAQQNQLAEPVVKNARLEFEIEMAYA